MACVVPLAELDWSADLSGSPSDLAEVEGEKPHPREGALLLMPQPRELSEPPFSLCVCVCTCMFVIVLIEKDSEIQ
jgi:hypothetical protein